MNSPLVSIVVPVYNSEAFLKECIDSLINQTYNNIEIILVDDGSPDNSGLICDQYAANDSRIKVIHKNNSGLVSARKDGLKLSTGEYVFYVDGDDWVEINLIEDYLKAALEHNADVVIAAHKESLVDRIEVYKNKIPSGCYNKEELISTVYPKMMYNGKFSQFGIFSYSWGKLYRRDLLLNNQLKVRDGVTIGEDALCLYPTLLDANIVVILEQPYHYYRQRTDSLTKVWRTIDVSIIEKVYQDFKDIFSSKKILDVMLPQLQHYILSLLTVSTDGITGLYPFNKPTIGKNLVICGGGTFGRHIYKKITNTNEYNIVGWIDEWYEYYSKLNLPVAGFNSIELLEYDNILIAFIDEDNSDDAATKLIKQGVPKEKIIQVSHYEQKENIQNLLLEYKINL
jgi:glycosyltransferase involved in cell wall biosynthesis